MIRLFVRHQVQDYATWRRAYNKFDAQRKPMGVTSHAVFQSVDDPNDVTAWHDFDNIAKAKAFVSSEALRDAMEEAGVKGQPEIWFVRARSVPNKR